MHATCKDDFNQFHMLWQTIFWMVHCYANDLLWFLPDCIWHHSLYCTVHNTWSGRLQALSGEEFHSPRTYIVFFNGTILGVHRRPKCMVLLTRGLFEMLSFFSWKACIVHQVIHNWSEIVFAYFVASELIMMFFLCAAVCSSVEEIAPGRKDWQVC